MFYFGRSSFSRYMRQWRLNFWENIILMLIKLLVVLGIYGILLFSGYELYTLIFEHREDLQKLNVIKFQFLFYIHIFLGVAIGVLLKFEQFYHQVLAAFFIFFAIFVAIFVCETVTHYKPEYEELLLNEDDKEVNELESAYSDIYYLVYMYAIMGLTLTGMFIFVSEGMAYWHSPSAGRYDPFIDRLDFKDDMFDMECPICLTEFAKDGRFCAIKKCGHVFHEQCLKEWLKYNKTCPLDRASILL